MMAAAAKPAKRKMMQGAKAFLLPRYRSRPGKPFFLVKPPGFLRRKKRPGRNSPNPPALAKRGAAPMDFQTDDFRREPHGGAFTSDRFPAGPYEAVLTRP